jgi:hypothetical protein
MITNLLQESQRTRVINSTAAGTTNVNGTVLDMQGFESVLHEVMFGALTATQVTSIKIQGGNLANGSDMADLANTKVGPLLDTQSNFVLVSDIIKPVGFRYIRVVVVRGTANAVIDGAMATQYAVKKLPASSDDPLSVSATRLTVAPVAGTP